MTKEEAKALLDQIESENDELVTKLHQATSEAERNCWSKRIHEANSAKAKLQELSA